MTNNTEKEVQAKVLSLSQSDDVSFYLVKFEAVAKKLLKNLETSRNICFLPNIRIR